MFLSLLKANDFAVLLAVCDMSSYNCGQLNCCDNFSQSLCKVKFSHGSLHSESDSSVFAIQDKVFMYYILNANFGSLYFVLAVLKHIHQLPSPT